MNEFISKKIVEVLILQALQEKDMYGYDIEQSIKEMSDNSLNLPPSYLYPVLYSLEERGLATSHHEIVGKRLRKYYHLEETGKSELNVQKKQARETLLKVVEILK